MSAKILSSAKWLLDKWNNDRIFAIWAVSLLVVAIRLAVSFAFKTYESLISPADDHFAFGVEWGRIARWLVERGMFSLNGNVPTADTDPLYVFIVAPFFQIFGTFSTSAAIGLIALQSILCGLSAWALFVLAEKLYGPAEARLSALLFALYPASIAFAVSRIGPSILCILLISLIFIIVLDLPKSGRPVLAVLAGFFMGLLALAAAHVLSLLLVVPLWLLLVGSGQRTRMLLLSLIFVGTAILVTLPWSIRNSTVLGHAAISKANLGVHVWVGNNPGATGYGRTTKFPDDEFYKQHGREPNFIRMAASWALEHPQDFLRLTGRRVKYFWYRIPEEGRGHTSPGYLIHIWTFQAVLVLAVLGVCWPGEKFKKVSLLLLFLGIFPLLFYLTHVTHYRQRFHIEPFALILASRGLRHLWLTGLSIKMAQRPTEAHMGSILFKKEGRR